MMKHLLFLGALLGVALADSLPPSCKYPVFCDSLLLHHVQMYRIFSDSKYFVDLHMKDNANSTLEAFDELLNQTNNNPTKEQVQEFVNNHFNKESELENWTPTDYNPDPVFLSTIRDKSLRQFAKDINSIWPTLGRRVKDVVFEEPERFSFIPVSEGFIIPGGRFRELYYWDAYWIVEGLLICGMQNTVRGMIENLIQLLTKVGHIPNGSRWYYQERSQPPLLIAMMYLYVHQTGDFIFLKENLKSLGDELQYWLDTQRITFTVDDKAYTLLRYNAPSAGPRPESYYEDYSDAHDTFQSPERQQEFYVDLKSAAESGWDFSTRWFISENGDNSGNLTNIHTRDIIPVDLNSIFASALQTMAYFEGLLGNSSRASHWLALASQWKLDIEKVLWNKEDGVWYDYDLKNKIHRKYFYPSNVSPLWTGAVDKENVKEHAPRIIKYLKDSHGLDFPGGIPSSLIRSGEQWDFPNAWPPLVSIVVNALEALDNEEAYQIAFEVAQTWVRVCHKGYLKNKQMFEKYDAEVAGEFGGGGEYNVQEGFGWSNGVVLEFLAKYGQKMTASDDVVESSSEVSSTTSTKASSASVELNDNSDSSSSSDSEDDDIIVKDYN